MKIKFTKLREKLLIQYASITLSTIGLIFGAVLSMNYNSNLPRLITPAVPFIALKEMEIKLDNQQQNNKERLAGIDEQVATLERQTKSNQGQFKTLIDEVEDLKVSAGMTDLSGEGILVVLDDSSARKYTPNSIAHASDMRDLIDYLWTKGARAISIKGAGANAERVGSGTSIDCIVNTVLINSTKIVPPFEIRAIGDRKNLVNAINDRQALDYIYDRVEKEGLKFQLIDGVEIVKVPKYTGAIPNDFVEVE